MEIDDTIIGLLYYNVGQIIIEFDAATNKANLDDVFLCSDLFLLPYVHSLGAFTDNGIETATCWWKTNYILIIFLGIFFFNNSLYFKINAYL